MDAGQWALLHGYVRRSRELQQWVRLSPASAKIGGVWRRILEVRRLGFVLELVCEGSRRLRLPVDIDRILRTEMEVERLLPMARAAVRGGQIRRVGSGTLRGGPGSLILRLMVLRAASRIATIVAGPATPRSAATRLVTTLVLWWDRLSGVERSVILIPLGWGDYLVELLRYLAFPVECFRYSPSGAVERIFPRGNRPAQTQAPYVIFPVRECPSRQLVERAGRDQDLDLVFRSGRWELCYRGLPVLWCSDEGNLFFDHQYPRPLVEPHFLDRHLREVRAMRRWPPPEPRSFYYRWSSERWLESLILKDHRAVTQDLEEQIYCQVPTFIEGDRKVIDLLGVTRSGRVAVIELKPRKDPGVLYQGLEYWERVRFHLEMGDLQRAGYFPGMRLSRKPPLLFLVSPLFEFHRVMPRLRRHLARQLHCECVGINSDWKRKLKILRRFQLSGNACGS